MNIFPSFKKKEAGLPTGLMWTNIAGIWMPYDNKDSVYVDNAYKAIPIVQSIVSKIAEKAADAPAQLMTVKDERKAKEYYLKAKYAVTQEKKLELNSIKLKAFEQLDKHPYLDLLDNPNPMQSGRQLREEEYGYLLITGNAIEYAAMPGMGSRATQPIELWSIPSPCVKPVMSGDRRNPISGYEVTYSYGNEIPLDQITHFRYFNPISYNHGYEESYWGLSPLRSNLSNISQKKYADIAQGSLFANMSPAGLISGNSGNAGSVRGELTQEQAIGINQAFRQNHMGAHNAGDIIVTPADIKWTQIGLSPVDMGILSFNEQLDRQIANAYGFPISLLNADGVQANSSEGNIRLITNCVLPLLRKFDDIRTQKIRKWYNDDSLVYLSDTDIYPELEVDKGKQVEWMRKSQVLTDQEIREALGYETEFDPSQVQVSSSTIYLSDLRLGDLPIGDENV